MHKLSLEEFIYQVKKELLDAQEEHKGEPGYFQLRDVELEVSVTATYSGEGKLNVQVVQIGSEVAKEHTHTVKLVFGLVQPPLIAERLGETVFVSDRSQSQSKSHSQDKSRSQKASGRVKVFVGGPNYQRPPIRLRKKLHRMRRDKPSRKIRRDGTSHK